MKNYFRLSVLFLALCLTMASCREDKKKKDQSMEPVEGIEMQEDAEMKVKEDKIKMEDSEKEVKIKMDEETGEVEKIKVDPKEE